MKCSHLYVVPFGANRNDGGSWAWHLESSYTWTAKQRSARKSSPLSGSLVYIAGDLWSLWFFMYSWSITLVTSSHMWLRSRGSGRGFLATVRFLRWHMCHSWQWLSTCPHGSFCQKLPPTTRAPTGIPAQDLNSDLYSMAKHNTVVFLLAGTHSCCIYHY